ncbi:MAG TPA: thioredoxin domain-containing protein [Flavobacterium sp.]|nr:thioredoxin domain-containing protein [Flavobacterium sp.]
MKNQLQYSPSPYLLQHADNPVFWQMWNDENITKADQSGKLMLISIGYAACHWCHVMAHECFEDIQVAEVMNKYFTNFKIDREEFPGVDAYYMQALQLMTQQGGWPLNIVALPNGLPVWGATYLPKEQWIDVLEQLASLFESNPEKMLEYAEKLSNGISLANNTLEIYPKQSNKTDLLPLINQWKKSFDLEYGGHSRTPKFMMPTNLNFLYRYGKINRQDDFIQHVELTLTRMAQGGLFDVIEGGFSRYSVDHRWHIPHFEKMLYDNAQLLSIYSRAYIDTQNPLYKEVVRKTVDFILENWQDSSGGFYAAYDADSLNSEGIQQEGAYYFWKKEELKQLIPEEEWHLFQDVFSINEQGFWEEADAYVFFQDQDLTDIARFHQISIDQLIELKEKWEQILKNKRIEKSKPLLDDKIICSWNALLLSGFLDAQKVLSTDFLSQIIHRLSHFLQHTMYNDELGRVFKNDTIYIKGALEDYAFTIKAFIDLFNHSQNIQHLQFAQTLTFQTLDFFFDETQGFFKSDKKQSIGTVFEIEDNVIPSANAVMSRNLFYLGILFKNDYFIKTAEEMTSRVLNQAQYASAFSDWLLNDLIFKQDFEYIIIKQPTAAELNELNFNNQHRIILDYSLNIPILDAYKNQEKRIQICNRNSCRLQTDDFDQTFIQ